MNLLMRYSTRIIIIIIYYANAIWLKLVQLTRLVPLLLLRSIYIYMFDKKQYNIFL